MTTASRSGFVGEGSKAQHIDLYRKLLIRRELLAHAPKGAVYVPFIGDGDIAGEVYQGRSIFGADIDPDRAEIARGKLDLAGGEVRVFDCNDWPFPGLGDRFAIADLDAYSNPYPALVSFWVNAQRESRVAIFGTDGERMAFRVSRTRVVEDLLTGTVVETDISTRREAYNNWWQRMVRPFIETTIAPWTITAEVKYQRSHMLYWGVIVEPPASADRADLLAGDSLGDRDQLVEDALFEAARSGNVAAIVAWQDRHNRGDVTGSDADLGFEPPAPQLMPGPMTVSRLTDDELVALAIQVNAEKRKRRRVRASSARERV